MTSILQRYQQVASKFPRTRCPSIREHRKYHLPVCRIGPQVNACARCTPKAPTGNQQGPRSRLSRHPRQRAWAVGRELRLTVAVFCFALFHLCGLGSGCFQHLVKTTSPREKFTCTCGPILGLRVSPWERGVDWVGLALPLYTHSPSSLPKWGPDLVGRLCRPVSRRGHAFVLLSFFCSFISWKSPEAVPLP